MQIKRQGVHFEKCSPPVSSSVQDIQFKTFIGPGLVGRKGAAKKRDRSGGRYGDYRKGWNDHSYVHEYPGDRGGRRFGRSDSFGDNLSSRRSRQGDFDDDIDFGSRKFGRNF